MATYTTAIANVFKAVRAKLVRTGVNVGGTASYPRVEIHSVIENAPETKDDSLRSITCTIECLSDAKVADAVKLVEDNTALIFSAAGLSMQGYTLVGIEAGQIKLFDEQIVNDQNMVLYRLLQDITIWVERN